MTSGSRAPSGSRTWNNAGLPDRVAPFASKLAPTEECIPMWERACSRRGPPEQHKIRNLQ
ncbi:hypothetical protein FGA82_12110 [Pseudomonas fluorescens]|nr:hypothetical protein FGA82_12110 [Pseudomonas fluorescens]